MRRHFVHDPAGAGDQAVAAFFLDTGQATEEFISDVFAQTFFAKSLARDVQALGTDRRLAIGFKVIELEAGHLDIVNLAQVVVQANHFQPLRVRRDHAPGGQVVQRRAPENRFFTAGVHGDVAAYARGFGRGWVDRKNKTSPVGHVGHALRDHTGFGPDGGDRLSQAGQHDFLHLGHGFEFFGVDHRRLPGQGNGAAGIACAAATWHDRQTQFNAGLDHASHFDFGVRCQHHKRVLDAPVCRIGHMRHPGQTVKFNIVFLRALAELSLCLATQLCHGLKRDRKPLYRRPRQNQ